LAGVEVKSKDIISSLFWMIVGAGVCYGGVDLELGTLHDPGSGFIFFWVGLIMVGLSLSIFIRALKEKGKAGEMRLIWSEVQWKKIVSVLVALFLYGYFFQTLGFILSAALLLVFLFKAVEPQRWSVAILGAVVSSLVAYVVFQVWLGSQLPKGLLDIG
jgi:putative tricarboxylic transport membrane protein